VISRRDLLISGGIAVAESLVPETLRAQSEGKTRPEKTPAPKSSPAAAIPANAASILLEPQWIEKTINGTRVKLRSYNGQVPGPMISAKPGEALRILLKNSLPPNGPDSAWDGSPNVPHHYNTTNLHQHGLDIAPHLFEPLGTSDPLARMISIPPGGQKEYLFQIPPTQPPGLYWYHPHHHGSTAIQVVSGMAGGLIVYGDIDQVPEIKAARDIPLIVQDLGLFPSETVPDLWTYDPNQNAIWQTFSGNVTIYDPKTGQSNPTTLQGGFTTGDYKLRYFLLNGEPFFQETHNYSYNMQTHPVGKQLAPTQYKLAPGEVVRFRMLNACSDNVMPLVVEDHDLYLIAMDGVNFPTPRKMPYDGLNPAVGQMLLAPGNRGEFLIKASLTPGTYRIVQLAQEEQFLTSEKKVIAEIEVEGPPKDMPLPAKLPIQERYANPILPSDVQRIRNFVFGDTFPGVVNPYVGIDFTINNNQYQELAIPHVVELERAEEWHIQVLGAHHGGTEGHPFHIHVNHFEVVSIDGTPLSPVVVQDTVWVPMKSTVVIRMRFKEWLGKSVFHCHILPHEDTGMMQNFLIHKGAVPMA